MAKELTEEQLAEIEREATKYGYDGICPPETLALVAEVRRLREVENECEEARGLAREYLYALRMMNPNDICKEELDKDVKSHPWLLKPEHATATGVAESTFGIVGDSRPIVE